MSGYVRKSSLLCVLISCILLMLCAMSGCGTAGEALPLKGVSCWKGGGMDGGYESISLMLQEDGTVLAKKEVSKWYDEEPVQQELVLTEAALEPFRQITAEYDIPAWVDLPMSELQVLDAPTSSLTFYTEEDSYTFNDRQDLPAEGFNAFGKTWDALEAVFPELES